MKTFVRVVRIALAIALGLVAVLLLVVAIAAHISREPGSVWMTIAAFGAGFATISYFVWPRGVGGSGGSYLDRTLHQGERVETMARLHWIMFVRPLFVIIVGCLMALSASGALIAAGVVLAVVASIRLLVVLIEWWTTEIAITDRRVLVKVGLIARDTVEINATKIESVDVSQSLLGRPLNYGTIIVRGTGGHINRLKDIDDPLSVRKAIARV